MKCNWFLFSLCAVLAVGSATAQTMQLKKPLPMLKPTTTAASPAPSPAQPAQINAAGRFGNTVFTKGMLKAKINLQSTNPQRSQKMPDGTTLTTKMLFHAEPYQMAAGNKPLGEVFQTDRNKRTENQDGWSCTTSDTKVSLQDDSFMSVAYAQQAANIYPGAVYTFDNFFGGKFNADTSPRNPLRIVTSTLGVQGNAYEDVANPSGADGSEIKTAMNKLFNRLPADSGMGSYQSKIYEVNSAADTLLKLGAGASYYGVSASFDYSHKNSEKHLYFLIDATQELFTLEAEPSADGIFTNVQDAQKPNQMMIGNVTYGQRVLVSYETTVTLTEDDIKTGVSYDSKVLKAKADLQSLIKNSSDETTVKMYVVGGTQQGFITLDKSELISKLNQYFKATTVRNAKPIKYQFRNMNNEVIRSDSATDSFVSRQCVPDAGSATWDVTVELTKIHTGGQKEIKFGIEQSSKALLAGGQTAPDVHGEDESLICWHEDAPPPCQQPRKFTNEVSTESSAGAATLGNKTYRIQYGQLDEQSRLEIKTTRIVMYSNGFGDQTHRGTPNLVETIYLKKLIQNKQPLTRQTTIPFNGRNFIFTYKITPTLVVN